MSSPPPPPHMERPKLDSTLGAAFLGTVAAAMLYGATNIQVFLYYTTYPNDRPIHKFAVALLWILDTIHLSLTVVAMYHYVITSFGLYPELLNIVWSYKLQIAINAIIVLFVQSLYARRVWILGRDYPPTLPILVCIVLAGGYCMGIALVVKAYTIDTFPQTAEIVWVVYGSFATATVVDFVVAGVMCFYLLSNSSGFPSTNNRIMLIIKMTITTGSLTSACSLACLICYAIMPDNLVYLGIEFLLTKLYINSFLAMLNARQIVRGKDTLTENSFKISRFNVRAIGTASSSNIATVANEETDTVRLTPLKREKADDQDSSWQYLTVGNDSGDLGDKGRVSVWTDPARRKGEPV